MKLRKLILLYFLFFGVVISTNGQLLKRLKQKVESKIEQKIDEKTDKIIENALENKQIESKETIETNLPATIIFTKVLHVETFTKEDEKVKMQFLIGDDKNMYGVMAVSDEMQGQAQVITVVNQKSSTTFINTEGFKMQQSASIEHIENQSGMNKLPEDGDVEYKKTGIIKTILGFKSEEYKVTYTIDNETASSVFWVSNDFPIQNISLPLLGMNANNKNFTGFVLEISTTYQNENWTMKVLQLEDKTIKINTNEYQKMH